MGPRLIGFLLLISLAICCPVQSAKVEKIVTSPKLEAFKNWLSENGARLDNLVITKAAAYGTTAVAPRDLGVRLNGTARIQRIDHLRFLLCWVSSDRIVPVER